MGKWKRTVTSAPLGSGPNPGELAALSTLVFDMRDAATVLTEAAAAVPRLAPCRAEAAYRFAGGAWDRVVPGDPVGPAFDEMVADRCGSGAMDVPGRAWGWASALKHRTVVEGTLVVSSASRPSDEHVQMLMVLASQTGAALACVALHRRDDWCTEELAKAATELSDVRRQLRHRENVQDTIEAALGGGEGEQAITDALHELTALPIALEDRFGNLRCWSGPGRPDPYPKADPRQREHQLAILAARRGAVRSKDRIAVTVPPGGEHLGILAIVDPRNVATSEDCFALHFAGTLLGHELSHQRRLVELEGSIRRELFEDLLAGTDDDGAVARAEALGHDLRCPHYAVAVHSSATPDTLEAAAARAAAALHLRALRGRTGELVVLLAAGRPDPRALYGALSEGLSPATCAVGIGSSCLAPSDVPRAVLEARRALDVQLHSASPAGAASYDELGFYRLIDAARANGVVEDFVHEWLGTLLDYDSAKKADLVATLGKHLECGGNYDDSAKALHIHRSTLRYRLARIGELTGYDLRDVDTRFNLHAALRAWRFFHSGSTQPSE